MTCRKMPVDRHQARLEASEGAGAVEAEVEAVGTKVVLDTERAAGLTLVGR